MNQVDETVDTLASALLVSEEYLEYKKQLDQVKQFPELKEKIDEYRRRNYELQYSPDLAFDKIDRFEREYRKFREDPLVSDFLTAELALCRLLQNINDRLMETISFE